MERDLKFYSKEKIFNEIFPISSLTGEGVANLIKFSKKFTIKTSIKSKPSSSIQIKKKLFYSEVTREKILDKIHREIPYQCDVVTEKINKGASQIKIYQSIVIKRQSHKNILVGKKGSMLKEIGQASRKEIARFENKKIHLFLFVKLAKEKKI